MTEAATIQTLTHSTPNAPCRFEPCNCCLLRHENFHSAAYAGGNVKRTETCRLLLVGQPVNHPLPGSGKDYVTVQVHVHVHSDSCIQPFNHHVT
ncbi:hypothetical protein VTI28DRAFT_4309 [Corynascus sepedonium]